MKLKLYYTNPAVKSKLIKLQIKSRLTAALLYLMVLITVS